MNCSIPPAVIGRISGLAVMLCWWLPIAAAQETGDGVAPQSTDTRLTIELVAEQPDIVTPTGIAVDRQSRIYVAESHTHFRPDNYQGPQKDRILLFEDTDADGKLERRVFHEGFTHVMDLEFHFDGSLYVATRRDVHRLEIDDPPQLSKITKIVDLETTGDYPHNGISGLAFDFAGNLHFGLGENLGHPYKLIGSDGRTLSGGGEGGSTYVVRADGSKLRRVSTGWWNPFGMCVDGMGRSFGTDNDPGASPPCRLIQLVEQGDYGYEYRYGRTGLHPLITWTGDIPGTLPMIAGTGEAPCSILSYESIGLPSEYYGQLLTASWADHRIERYQLEQDPERGLATTGREILIQGGNDFRPVGLAVGPRGAVYVSDWVSASYALHGRGRIWRIRQTSGEREPNRSGVESRDRFEREQEARRLADSEAGRRQLHRLAHSHGDPYVRAAALQALTLVANQDLPWESLFADERHPDVRLLIVKLAMERQADPTPYCDASRCTVAERSVAVLSCHFPKHEAQIHAALDSSDARLFHAGVTALARSELGEHLEHLFSEQPLATTLALRRSGQLPPSQRAMWLSRLLTHPEPAVVYTAVKWIADEQLQDHRREVAARLQDPSTDYRLFLATVAALDRLDEKPPQDRPSAERLLQLLNNEATPDPLRALALRMIPPDTPDLREQLEALYQSSRSVTVQLETVRTMAAVGDEQLHPLLVDIATDRQRGDEVRAAAVAGLAASAHEMQPLLVRLAFSGIPSVRSEALRSLVGVELREESRKQLEKLAANEPGAAEAVARLLDGQPGMRPAATKLDHWLQLLAGAGDASIGEQVFFGTKVGTCSKCHSIDGRGTDVGPDLSHIARRLQGQGPQADRWLLETILQPSKEMAPQYTPWMILTTDGKTHVGLPRRKGGSAEAYLGIDGKEFTIQKADIELHREQSKSIMPDDLLRPLTVSELQGLFAFLRQSATARQQAGD